MKTFTLINEWTGEIEEFEAINFDCDKGLLTFYIYEKDERKFITRGYALRNWRFRNVEPLDK